MADGIDCVVTPPNKGSEKKAIVAMARKLAVRMRAIELTERRYCIAVIE